MNEKLQKKLPVVMLTTMIGVSLMAMISQYYGDADISRIIRRIQFVLVISVLVVSLFLLYKRVQAKKKSS